MTTLRNRTLPRWRLRLAYALLGLDYARQPRVEIELWTAVVWGAKNPNDVSEIITYTRKGGR